MQYIVVNGVDSTLIVVILLDLVEEDLEAAEVKKKKMEISNYHFFPITIFFHVVDSGLCW